MNKQYVQQRTPIVQSYKVISDHMIMYIGYIQNWLVISDRMIMYSGYIQSWLYISYTGGGF